MIAHLLIRRALTAGLVFAACGFWQAVAHLPPDLGLGTYTVSSFWAVAIFSAAGLLVAVALAGLAIAVTAPLPMRRRPTAAAAVETLGWLPLILWLVLNEVTYATTTEVLGYDAILMTWHNPAATFQNAWQMGGRYLIGVALATTIVAALLAWRCRSSFRTLWAATPPGCSAAQRGARPERSPLRLAAPITCSLFLLAVLLTWQLATTPGAALTAVLRSAPPLRALNLTRALLGDDLRLPHAGEPAGAPIIPDEAYAASISPLGEDPPNIVLIVLESVPARALHCYGYPRADVSPHMDALAAGGVQFDHCWSAASFSSYGLISIVTSLHLLRSEVNDHFTDHDFPHMSLPRAFKLAGYETALFSSGNEAFDHINAFRRPEDFDTYYSHDTSGIQHPDCMRMDDRFALERFESWIRERAAATRGPEDLAHETSLAASRPFYASFYLQSTHFDYEVPEPWSHYYQPTPPLYGNGNGIIRIPPDVLPLLRNQYDNALRYSDHWVGRIVAELKAAGVYENTVIAITADHGEAFMEHGLARHGVHLWEEMIHVPFIVHLGQKVRASLGRELPTRVADTVSGIDIAPTIAALAGIPPHPGWQGRDVLAPDYSSKDRPVFAVLQLTRWQEAVTVNKLKYIYDLSSVERHLYDLAADPGEQSNLVAAMPDPADALHNLLRIWHTHQLSYYDPANRPYERYIGMPEFPQVVVQNPLQRAELE